MTPAFPRRGEVWLVDFHPARGSEQRGFRPALVIQNDVGNRHSSTTIIATITSRVKVYPMTVDVRPGEGGLRKRSMVNLAQIFTVDGSRLHRCLGSLSAASMESVNTAIKASLDIP